MSNNVRETYKTLPGPRVPLSTLGLVREKLGKTLLGCKIKKVVGFGAKVSLHGVLAIELQIGSEEGLLLRQRRFLCAPV